jgi:DNA excision repair protein ERCC-3
LNCVAEPISRPNYIHKWKLTTNSLFAAILSKLKTEDILTIFKNLSKNKISKDV